MLKSKKFWTGAVLTASGLCCVACVALIAFSGLGKAAYQMVAFNRHVGTGRLAPDFQLTSLSGEAVQLKAWQGTPVVIVFSASWCPDCQREAPLLQSAYAAHPGLKMLWVDSGETEAEVRAFAQSYALSMPVASDTGSSVADAYDIYAIPTVFFVDQDGLIQTRLIERFDQAQIASALHTIGVTP